MSEEDLGLILDACKFVPAMLIFGLSPSRQDAANHAWAALGRKMGFDSQTVEPVKGKGDRWFTAIPLETEDQRTARLAEEAEKKRLGEIEALRARIERDQDRLKELGWEVT
jgi:hypothetical protein